MLKIVFNDIIEILGPVLNKSDLFLIIRAAKWINGTMSTLDQDYDTPVDVFNVKGIPCFFATGLFIITLMCKNLFEYVMYTPITFTRQSENPVVQTYHIYSSQVILQRLPQHVFVKHECP